MDTNPLPQDFAEFLKLLEDEGVEFEECYARRRRVDMGEVEVNMISLEDLKTNKRASGRHKDLEDIEHLP